MTSRLEDRTRGWSIHHREDRLDAVWAATFGAAYADDVAHFERLAEAAQTTGGYASALDLARRKACVERAMTIANDAVRNLRKWFADGNGDPVDEDPTLEADE